MSTEVTSNTLSRSRGLNSGPQRLPRVFRIPQGVVISSHLTLRLSIGIALVQGAGSFLSNIGNPWRQIQDTLPAVTLVCGAGAILLWLVGIIERKWRAYAEYPRKLAHVGAGAISLALPALFSNHWPVLIVTIIFSLALLLSRRSEWLSCLHSDSRRGKSDILFLWAVYLVFLMTNGNPVLFQVPILVLTVGDAAAALIGQRYGRIHYRISGNIRSLEGTMAFAATTFVCLFAFCVRIAGMALEQSAALSFAVAIIASAVEALTPKGLDNLTVPIAALFVLQAFLR